MAQANDHLEGVSSSEQALPTKKGVPLLIENNITNTVDLYVAATNFVRVADDFANELAAYLMFKHYQAANDPITDTSKLFTQLNDKSLKVKKNIAGGQDAKVKKILTTAIDPKLIKGAEIWKTDAEGAILTDIKNNQTRYKAYNKKTKTDRWVTVTKDVIRQVEQKVRNLKSTYGFKDMKEEFLLHWIERFYTAHDAMKAMILENMSSKEKHYFQPLCDSIGSMFRMDKDHGYNLSSIDLSLNDTTYETSGVHPIPHSPIIDDKIDQEHKRFSVDSVKKTGPVFRNNMKHILEEHSSSKTPHKQNLIPDKEHWTRMTGGGDQSLVQEATGKISDAMGDVYRVISYIRTAQPDFNKQKVKLLQIELAVEQTLVKVDLVGNIMTGKTKKPKKNDIILSRPDPKKKLF